MVIMQQQNGSSLDANARALLRRTLFDAILESLDVPPSAYEAAESRYRDLGNWLNDPMKAKSAGYKPHIFPQGSFRLGTVTRPWGHEDYDLDLACKLRERMTKSNITQEKLKGLVGMDLQKYRSERGIIEPPEEKHRCWRLNYQNNLKFHMDIVPAIPEDEARRNELLEGMINTGSEELLARDVTKHAMAVTDDRHEGYRVLTNDWQVCNQEEYALWFESRMRSAAMQMQGIAARVDELPAYRWKTPLQQCIQILKRHRDMMFEHDPNGKPISAIITTLAAHSYNGELDIESALFAIIEKMAAFVKLSRPRVPNPVNPQEDFADKWPIDQRLERNFWLWLDQLKKDFMTLAQSDDIKFFTETVQRKFGTIIDEARAQNISLLLKAVAITSGTARTTVNGTIGLSGVENLPHKFYG